MNTDIFTFFFSPAEKKYKCDKMCEVRELDLICGSRRRKFRKYIRRNRKSLITAEFEIQMKAKDINSMIFFLFLTAAQFYFLKKFLE